MINLLDLEVGFLSIKNNGLVDNASDLCKDILEIDPIGKNWSDIYVAHFTPSRGTYHTLGNGKSVDIQINTYDEGIVVFINEISEIIDLSMAIGKNTTLNSMSKMAQTISHQLKTPLSIAMIQSELLEDECPRSVKKVTKIKDNIMLITELLDSIFVFGNTGQENPEVNNSLDLMKSVKSNYGTAVKIDLTGENVAFVGNKRMLVSAISNLIDNSTKESENASIGINSSKIDGNLVLSYTDNAGGFTKNVNLLKSHRTTSSGSSWGIGMSVTRFIIEAHGGSISYSNNEKADGVEIIITIPSESSIRR